jgi:hypothetical protein
MSSTTSRVNTCRRRLGEIMMRGEITTVQATGLMVVGGNKPHPSMREGGIVQTTIGGTQNIKVDALMITREIPSALTTTIETRSVMTTERSRGPLTTKDLMIILEMRRDLKITTETTDVEKMIKSAVKRLQTKKSIKTHVVRLRRPPPSLTFTRVDATMKL